MSRQNGTSYISLRKSEVALMFCTGLGYTTPGRLWPGQPSGTASRSAVCGGPNKFNAEGPHSTYGYRGQRFWAEVIRQAR